MDILTSLLMSATLRKARALEQWLVNHRHCEPRPCLEFSDDNMFEVGRCSCGSELRITVVIDLVIKEVTKCLAA